mgnify:FL=1
MFENRKRNKKIQDFRKDGLKVTQYDKNNCTITLESRGGRRTTLAFKLVDFDGNRQLSFSGDLITSDGEALSRVMKVMWNEELPQEFWADEALRKQLFGEELVVATEEVPEPEEPETPEPHTEGGENDEGNNAGNAGTAPAEPQKPSPIYFRDMAAYVTGQPNEVIVTVKASYRIDNE